MTLSAPERAHAKTPASREHRVGRLAPLRLPLRLTRRGAGLMVLVAAFYGAVEVVSYQSMYPDAASRARLAEAAEMEALRAFQGVPHGVDTVGGFVVWDAGWFVSGIVAIWAMLVTTRLLRAEEDAGRADLVLATPVTPVRLMSAQLVVVGAGCLAFGLGFAAPMVLLGVGASGSLLFALGLAGVGWTSAGLAAVAAQTFDVRRKAVGVTSGVLGALFALRMVANSSDDRLWMLNLTPFGWLDRLEPFAGERWSALLPAVLVPVVLVGAAAAARRSRDGGGALVAGREERRPRRLLLSGTTAFEWRLTTGNLLAWATGVFLYSVLMGSLLRTLVDFLEDDPQYAETMESFGYDMSVPVDAFVGFLAVFNALLFVLYVAWRVGALRTEEASGRLEHLLVRGVVRRRWLAAGTVSSLLAAAAVAAAAAVGTWAGAALTDGDLTLRESAAAQLPTLPVVVLFAGIAVLAFGVRPRLTVALPVALASVTFVLTLLGPMLDVPQAVLDASPFQWLPRPPLTGFSGPASAGMVGLGLLAAAAGVRAFGRRDVVGD